MTTQVKPAQTNADTWVLRCPRGHTSIPKSAESLDSYRCDSCGCSYDHGPYDATEWEFPVLPPHERTVLEGTKAKQLLKEGMK